jgi:hypothetical protein
MQALVHARQAGPPRDAVERFVALATEAIDACRDSLQPVRNGS